jgi:hypothetical protein
MVRAVMPLWSVLSLISVSGQVAATPPGQPAVTGPAVSCEQPANSIAVPPPKSEPDATSLINRWMAEEETISQMETWWRARSKQPAAFSIKPVSPATKGAISQMETWWQHRTDLRPAMTVIPQRPHRRQRHYAASATEFGCPASVCSRASPTGPNATPYDQSQEQYQQSERLYRELEAQYHRQLELQRAEQGR